ncbi:MAG: hypothetical protein PHS24_00515 [Bacilli bacterium]|nr:hypothetical protein [Bacilli bacterium]MDD4705683.1 hypothetical protein [Bacilli bacterium]
MCHLNYNKEIIKEEKKSPEVVMIYNKKYNNKNKEKRISKMIPPEKSIEFRQKKQIIEMYIVTGKEI